MYPCEPARNGELLWEIKYACRSWPSYHRDFRGKRVLDLSSIWCATNVNFHFMSFQRLQNYNEPARHYGRSGTAITIWSLADPCGDAKTIQTKFGRLGVYLHETDLETGPYMHRPSVATPVIKSQSGWDHCRNAVRIGPSAEKRVVVHPTP